MEFNPKKLSDVKKDMYVEIKDMYTSQLIQGKIVLVISQTDDPDGILVKLDIGNKGRVNKIISADVLNITEKSSNKMELLPESFNLEYKQTFRYHGAIPTDEWIPGFNVFKAIAGLANAEGGKLIIGVQDEKNQPLKIFGLKKDFELIGNLKNITYSADQDGMALRLIHECEHYFPKQELVKTLIRTRFIGETPDKMICVIDVARSTDAVIMYDSNAPEKKRGPHFYVRVNNQTLPFEPYTFCRYWAKHLVGIVGEEKLMLSQF